MRLTLEPRSVRLVWPCPGLWNTSRAMGPDSRLVVSTRLVVPTRAGRESPAGADELGLWPASADGATYFSNSRGISTRLIWEPSLAEYSKTMRVPRPVRSTVNGTVTSNVPLVPVPDVAVTY
jgi:hypothetical protein